MSPVLAMVLAAGMAVSGNGPEKVPGEMERGLDLRGEWEGTLKAIRGMVAKAAKATVKGNYFWLYDDGEKAKVGFRVEDEGRGNLRMKLGGASYLGIYRQEKNRLIICFGDRDGPRPSSFGLDKSRVLLILHRAKSQRDRPSILQIDDRILPNR